MTDIPLISVSKSIKNKLQGRDFWIIYPGGEEQHFFRTRRVELPEFTKDLKTKEEIESWRKREGEG